MNIKDNTLLIIPNEIKEEMILKIIENYNFSLTIK